MKEAYFTPSTIHRMGLSLLEEVRNLRDRHTNMVFDPNKAALLVLDMQYYFMSKKSHAYLPSAYAIIPGIKNLIHVFKKRKRPVIFTRHINQIDDARLMALWWKDLISPSSSHSKVTSALDTRGCMTIIKNQYDAFFETNLESYLRDEKVEQVCITGVMTHLCCETTTRSAFTRGFRVLFTVDGTATYNAAFHRASLLNLSHGFALPMLVNEIIEGFQL